MEFHQSQPLLGRLARWEGVTDHNTLRHDLTLQTAVGRAGALAPGPTPCRLEVAASPAHTAALHGVLLDQFIASHAEAPTELVLDIDATHMPLIVPIGKYLMRNNNLARNLASVMASDTPSSICNQEQRFDCQ